MSIFLYILLGVGAGFLSGLLGVGGGVVIVPALMWIFSLQEWSVTRLISMAAGTSCAIMVITTARALVARRSEWAAVFSLYRKMALYVVLGAVAGATLSHVVHPKLLCVVFSFFLLFVATNLLLPQHVKLAARLGIEYYKGAGAVIGFFAAMLGIGGGSLTVPYLLHNQLSVRRSTMVALMLSGTLAPFAALVYMVAGWSIVNLPGTTGYVYWPAVVFVGFGALIGAPLGVRYSQRISTKLLQRYFACLLLIVSVHLFVVSL